MPAPEAGDVRTHGEVLALVTHLAQNLASALALPYGVASLLLAGTDFDAETAALRASTPSGLRRQLGKCVGVAELAGDAALGKVEETTTGDDGCPYCMDDLFSGAADDAAVAPGWCNHAAHRSCWLEYLEHEVRANPCHAPHRGVPHTMPSRVWLRVYGNVAACKRCPASVLYDGGLHGRAYGAADPATSQQL